jgi:hypothetical protein
VLRRVLSLLALGALVVVLTAVQGLSTTASLSGTIALVNGGIQVTITNNGPDRTTYIWIKLAGGVQHTGASTTGAGGGCGPGPDAVTVKCGYGLPSNGFLPGESRTVTIMTDRAYPASGGAQLFWGETTNGPLVAAGKATGPSTPSTSPPAGDIVDPCTCTSLTAKIVPGSLKVRYPTTGAFKDLMALSLQLRWTMTCDKGDGDCSAKLAVRDPRGATYTARWAKPAAPRGTVECEGDCAETTTGTRTLVLVGDNLEPHDLAGLGRLPVVIDRTCEGRRKPLAPIRLSIAFKRNGSIDLANSKLG